MLKSNHIENYSLAFIFKKKKIGSGKYYGINVSLNQTDRDIWSLIYFPFCSQFWNKELNFMKVILKL